MSTFGSGTFGSGRFGDPEYVFVDGQYKRLAWKVRWDEGYEGKVGFKVPELEDMRYAAPQMEQGELPTAFALNPDDLLPGRVEGGGGLGHIAADTIIGDDIQAESVHADRIVSNSITATQIEAASITATELDVAELSAISGRMGELAAGIITLDGSTLLPGSGSGEDLTALIQSSDTNPRVVLDEDGVTQYDEEGNRTLRLGPGESLGIRASDTEILPGIEADFNSYTNGNLTGQDSWEAESGSSSMVVSGSAPNKLVGVSSSSTETLTAANTRPFNFETQNGWVLETQVRLQRDNASVYGAATLLLKEEGVESDVTGLKVYLYYSSNIVNLHVVSRGPAGALWDYSNTGLSSLPINTTRDYTLTISGVSPNEYSITVSSSADSPKTSNFRGAPHTLQYVNPILTAITDTWRTSAGAGTHGAYFKTGLAHVYALDAFEERKLLWYDSTAEDIAAVYASVMGNDSPDFPPTQKLGFSIGSNRSTAIELTRSLALGERITASSGANSAVILDDSGASDFARSNRPFLHLYTGDVQSLPTSTWVKLSSPSTITYDTHGGWDFGNSWYVVPEDGLYLVIAWVKFGSNATGSRYLAIHWNNAASAGEVSIPALPVGSPRLISTSIAACAKGETLHPIAYHDRGTTLNKEMHSLTIHKLDNIIW